MIDNVLLYEIIRHRIRTYRERHPQTNNKLTQASLATAIGIERSTLTNIELGNQRPPIHVLYALCEYFGLERDQFLPSLKEVRRKRVDAPTQVRIGNDLHDLPAKTSAVIDKLRRSTR